METTTRFGDGVWKRGAIPLFLALALVTPALAWARVLESEAPETPAELQEEALALARGGKLIAAAEMLVEGTERLAESAESAELLVLAARLYGHGAREREAYRTLRRAAVVAFRVGESERAAHLLIDAAALAMEGGHRADANEAADLAGYVLRVSNLTPEQRASVLRRVEYPAG